MIFEMAQQTLTVLDVGTSSIVCLQVQFDDSQAGFTVLGHSVQACSGLNRGAVVDIDETVYVMRECVKDVQTQSGKRIREVVVGVSGFHVQSMVSNGMVSTRHREVTSLDVERVLEATKAIAYPDNQTILHVLPQEYIVDDQAGVMKPVGMNGIRLEARARLILVTTSALQNLVKCVEQCGLRVQSVVAQQLAAIHAVLSDDEQTLGVCLLDIGGGTTDISVCQRGTLSYVSSVAIAGSHVTNDVAVALCTPPKSAEKIKIDHGEIMADSQVRSMLIEVEALANQATKKVSKQLLSEVLEARYREIFAFVKRDLAKAGLLGQLPGGIVLTGGAANMVGIEALASKVFACPVRLARPNLPLKEEVESDAGYALSLGLVLQAMQKHDKLDVSRTGAMRRMWKQFQYWLDYHL